MSDDKLDFLDGEKPEVDEAETPEVEVEEPKEETVEAEAPEAEAPGEKEAALPPDVEEKQTAVPVTALLDERERRQAAEAEAKRHSEQLAELQKRLNDMQSPREMPGFDKDPVAATAAMVESSRLQQSRFFAEKEFGSELVAEAFEYFNQHPQESHALMQHASPFHAAVEHYKRQKFLSEVSDPDAWKEQQLAALREQVAAEVSTAQPSTPKTPPPSMAKAPSKGRDAITPGDSFDDVFR